MWLPPAFARFCNNYRVLWVLAIVHASLVRDFFLYLSVSDRNLPNVRGGGGAGQMFGASTIDTLAVVDASNVRQRSIVHGRRRCWSAPFRAFLLDGTASSGLRPSPPPPPPTRLSGGQSTEVSMAPLRLTGFRRPALSNLWFRSQIQDILSFI